MSPIETIEAWAEIYSRQYQPGTRDFQHFSGHGMAAQLLREYAALRRSLDPQTALDQSNLMDLPIDYSIPSPRDQAIREFTRLPRPGTPAAELTDRDKVALALAAGARFRTRMEGTMLHLDILDLVGVVDRGDGTWIVAIRRADPPGPRRAATRT